MLKRIISAIPNTITCLNLASGCIAVALAFGGHFFEASLAIFAAAVFDFLDGAMARLLKAYSDMGKELDSLSDLVSFGVAPAAMVYNAFPAEYSWCAIVIPICAGLRLAKFNVDTRQTTSFIGLPVPANALFWIGAVSFIQSHGPLSPTVMMVSTVLVSQLMLDSIPLFSLKFHDFRLSTENVMRYITLISAVILVILFGLSGFALTILLYIILGLIYPFLP